MRSPHQRTLNSESQKLFCEKVKEVEKITDKRMALSFMLPHHLPQNENSENASSNTNSDPDEHLWNLHSPVKNSPLSLDDIAQKADRVKKRLQGSHRKLKSFFKDFSRTFKDQNYFSRTLHGMSCYSFNKIKHSLSFKLTVF